MCQYQLENAIDILNWNLRMKGMSKMQTHGEIISKFSSLPPGDTISLRNLV